ncbi:sarcosine oxidase [Cryptococcus deuterogattii 99/473]|uniref:Sarcosine oxidase n=1 Tax=Cryptococcus deuterogattii Ram5 TaxID=1296110 RepID=A0A0D0TB32_9TREE|nr:sarcosine oxidase [Cryptococcus deuterogattii Ram5]KIY56925.1 sarcosine oxidase [Cryptococcus deuterogattii 99/473]
MGQSSTTIASQSEALASKDSKIVIIGGGGTMGSSTALHLSRRGFTDIRIMDVYPIPSNNSAGNDLNKIAGDDQIGTYEGVADTLWDAWNTDPVFKPYVHLVGKLELTVDEAEAEFLKAKVDKMRARGRTDVEWLDNEEDVRTRAPHLKNADIKGWRGLWCGRGGWVAARDALDSVGRELEQFGVKTSFGASGAFDSLILMEDGKTIKGVRAKDGSEYEADLVVLAAGAWSPALIDLEGQCISKCWVYAHLQLTPEEAATLKGIPTVYNSKYGFFFEPRPDNHLIKLCNEFPGYTNYQEWTPFGATTPQKISVPRSHADNPTDTIPTEVLEEIQRLIKMCLPQFADRPLINQSMCWCTDTDDAKWLLCEHPKWKGLVLATGDSGHTFKMLPVVGGQVADLIEGKMSEQRKFAWRWRPGVGDPNGTGRPGPPPKDLSEVDGWRHD